MKIIDRMVINKLRGAGHSSEYCLSGFSLRKKIRILSRRPHKNDKVCEILARKNQISSHEEDYLLNNIRLTHINIMLLRQHNLLRNKTFIKKYMLFCLENRLFKEFERLAGKKIFAHEKIIPFNYLLINKKTDVFKYIAALAPFIIWDTSFKEIKSIMDLPESILKKLFTSYKNYNSENNIYKGSYFDIVRKKETLEEYKSLIAYKVIDVNALDKKGKHILCFLDDISEIKFMITHGAEINTLLSNGESLLYSALKNTQTSVEYEVVCQSAHTIEIMIKHGALLQKKNGESNEKIQLTSLRNINRKYYSVILKHDLLNIQKLKIDIDDIKEYVSERENKSACNNSVLSVVKSHKNFSPENIDLSGIDYLSFINLVKLDILFSFFSEKQIRNIPIYSGVNLFMFAIQKNIPSLIELCIKKNSAVILFSNKTEVMDFNLHYQVSDRGICRIDKMTLPVYQLLSENGFIDNSTIYDLGIIANMEEKLVEYLFQQKKFTKENLNPVIYYFINYEIKGLRDFILESHFINAKTPDGKKNMLNFCTYNKRYVQFLLCNGIEILSDFEDYDHAIRSEIIYEYQRRIKQEKEKLNAIIEAENNQIIKRSRI